MTDLDWILLLPGPIIVGAKVAEYLKKHFPDLEIIDYKFNNEFGKDKIIFSSDIEEDKIIYTSNYEPDYSPINILEDLQRGAEIVKNN
jgi:hypothetical protein